MVDRATVEDWVRGYLRAWESNRPEDIGRLFAEDGRYFTAPHRPPWSGQEEIVQGWIDRKDEPRAWSFRHEILGIDGDTAFVRGWTTYRDDPDYSNLWMIRFAGDGTATEFTEWWMEVEE